MGLKKFVVDVNKERKRVRWPKADVLIPSIVVVLAISVLVGLVLFGEDLLGQKLIEILSNNAK